MRYRNNNNTFLQRKPDFRQIPSEWFITSLFIIGTYKSFARVTFFLKEDAILSVNTINKIGKQSTDTFLLNGNIFLHNSER